MVRRLALGSVPGSLLGVAFLHFLGTTEERVDQLVTRALGLTLMLVAISLLVGKAARASSEAAAGFQGVGRRVPAWSSMRRLVPMEGEHGRSF